MNPTSKRRVKDTTAHELEERARHLSSLIATLDAERQALLIEVAMLRHATNGCQTCISEASKNVR